MTLISNIDGNSITTEIDSSFKTTYLKLAKNKAEQLIKNSKFKYIIYGKEKEGRLYLLLEKTNKKPKEVFYICKEEE